MRKPAHFARMLLMATMFAGSAARAGAFTAGAGMSDIAIPASMFPVGEFAAQHDPLAVHVVVLDDGSKRIGIVVVDMTSISDPSIVAFKSILKQVAGVSPDDAIVVAAHNFSSPHVFLGRPAGFAPLGGGPGPKPQGGPPPMTPAQIEAAKALEGVIEGAVRVAATQAATLRPATVGFGAGISRINVNRDVKTPSGWWVGANDTGYADTSLGLLRVNDAAGRPMALLVNYAMQSSVMDGSARAAGGRLISSDIEGAVSRNLQNHYGSGTVAGFLVGAAGDQSPFLQADPHVMKPDGTAARADLHEAGFILVDAQAQRLSDDAIDVVDGIRPQKTAPALEVQRTSVSVPSQASLGGVPPTGPVQSYSFRPGPPVDVPVVLMRIGDGVIVGLQTELAASVGATIRQHSPFAHTMVVTMVDGGAKYMPDAQSYDRLEYEARSSRYAKGAAERAGAEILKRLTQMRANKR